ncbi:MAG: hypothetical protein JWL64_2502 [Frankiales bacterium]|nr:hypothetical protein [Frankiales bacterium]
MRWWPFGRRDAGRHALGAAVTSLPSGPLRMPVPLAVAVPVRVPVAVPVPAPRVAVEAPAVDPPAVEAPAVVAAAVEAPAVQAPSVGPVVAAVVQRQGTPRVELGFRDGSTASLQPDSAQARALEELARLLTSAS